MLHVVHSVKVLIACSLLDVVVQDPDAGAQGMLLFNYLVHEGYWDTADRVAQDILLGRVQVSEQVPHRHRCCLCLMRMHFTPSMKLVLHTLCTYHASHIQSSYKHCMIVTEL